MTDTPRPDSRAAGHTPASSQVKTLAAMAPHADPAWVEAFVVEQRLLGVPGRRIGDALATIETHLLDSGESAHDAFGPAVDYAREQARSEQRSSVVDAPTVISAVAGLVGVVALPRAFGAWLTSVPVTVTGGDLVMVGLLVVLALGLFVAADRILGLLVAHRALPFVVGPVLIAVFVGALLLWRDPLLSVPVLPVAAVALVCLAICAAVSWRQPADLVRDPAGRTFGGITATCVGNALLMPVIALVLCLFTWLTLSL